MISEWLRSEPDNTFDRPSVVENYHPSSLQPAVLRTSRSNCKPVPYLLLLLFLAAVGVSQSATGQSVVVGSKPFTESYVLGEIAKKLLTAQGLETTHNQGMGGTIILWQALLHGDIGCYPEYSGTIGEQILKQKNLSPEAMRIELQKQGIGMTGELGFNNTYALVMLRSKAEQLGIKTISDLKKHPDLRAGPTPEFLGRQDGWKPLLARYGVTISDVHGIEHGLGYTALKSDQIDLKDCYSTDSKIAEYDLVMLDDDLHFFPQYRALFLYRLDMPAKAIDTLKTLEGKIDGARMIALNGLAEKEKNYTAAAATFSLSGNKANPNNATDSNATDKNAESHGVSALAADKPTRSQTQLLLADIPRLTKQHLTLVGFSMLLAIVVGIPLGIFASRPGPLGGLLLGATGVVQTIPQLALLALFIPLLGIGPKTAIVALFFYSLLPIVRNTATGLQDIPGPIRESAAALGLEPFAQLRKVFLPMASRTILAGIKTSAVINVGAATLAGLIGGGGYGEPIQSGLNLNDTPMILQGAIPAALLALLVQFGFDLVDRVLIPKGLRLPPARD